MAKQLTLDLDGPSAPAQPSGFVCVLCGERLALRPEDRNCRACRGYVIHAEAWDEPTYLAELTGEANG